MKWNFFSQNWFECCSFAFSGPAFANEHKICWIFKIYFFQNFSQVRACGLEPKNERKLFQPKSIRILFSLAFSGPAVAIEHKIGGFSNIYFFQNFSQVCAGSRLRPWAKKWRNFFNQNRFEFCFFAFPGPAVAIEHKIGGFSKYIFFRFFTGPRLQPWAKNETKIFQPKSIRIRFSCILRACCCYWT